MYSWRRLADGVLRRPRLPSINQNPADKAVRRKVDIDPRPRYRLCNQMHPEASAFRLVYRRSAALAPLDGETLSAKVGGTLPGQLDAPSVEVRAPYLLAFVASS